VENNPFVKISHTEKTFMLYHKEKHHIQMRMWTQFKSVPYCDHFNPEEQYVLISLPKQPINPGLPYPKDVPSRRCVFRISLMLVFHKKIPMFQSRVEKGSIEKGNESFGIMTNWLQTKIEEHRLLHPLPKQKPMPAGAAAPKKKEEVKPVEQSSGASKKELEEIQGQLKELKANFTELSARLEMI
jgi:hypothetical protein